MKTKLRMQKERLLRLADYIETIPNKLWDMNKWVKLNNVVSDTVNEPPPPCKTVGCAVGHALTSGQIYGFEPEWGMQPWDFKYMYAVSQRDGRKLECVDAFAKSFGLTTRQANAISDPTTYSKNRRKITQKDVAARIRDIVKFGKITKTKDL